MKSRQGQSFVGTNSETQKRWRWQTLGRQQQAAKAKVYGMATIGLETGNANPQAPHVSDECRNAISKRLAA